MRNRLNTTLVCGRRCASQARPPRSNVGADHGILRFAGARKEKTRRWERRVRFFCYRSLRFQVCGLAVARYARKRGAACCYRPANFCSCSSTFLFFSNVFKFNRTLCGFASFSVDLRTHSSLGGDALYKARHMPDSEMAVKTKGYGHGIPRYSKKMGLRVKPFDSRLTSPYSRAE